jgi:hypothetical protein
MPLDRKAIALGAFVIAFAAIGGSALVSGCTVLTNDRLPDDAGIFEGGEAGDGGEAGTLSCNACISAACLAPRALCLTNGSCVGVIACGAAAGCDSSCQNACACDAVTDAGPSPERLHHAFTSCNDLQVSGTCSSACLAEHRPPSTLLPCGSSDDAGVDAGDLDAGDAGDAASDAAATSGSCSACAAANCSANVAACGTGTECAAFLACSSGCTSVSCVDDCVAKHATGKVAATELATCTASNCQIACEL